MGDYTLSRRALPSPDLHFIEEAVGTEGVSRPLAVMSPPPDQETYSYRSTSRDGVDEDFLADQRVFRNGFTESDPVYDRGHVFHTTVRKYAPSKFPEVYLMALFRGVPYFYRGPLIPDIGVIPSPSACPPLPSWGPSDTARYGQRAIVTTAPTSPHANLAQAVGELFTSAFPAAVGVGLWNAKTLFYRGLGDEYLNIQFGWVPFVKDIQKLARSLLGASQTIRQLSRDSGRQVRRRFTFPAEVAVEEMEYPSTAGNYRSASNMFSPDASLSPAFYRTKTRRTEREVWFSGAFTYLLNPGTDVLGKLQRYEQLASVLTGARLSPDQLWEIAPWSWLIDWKLNIGLALQTSEALATDGLVLRYGYLMVHTKVTDTYALGPGVIAGTKWSIPASNLSLVTERKERFRATPYGFSLDTSSLSGFQWSILAALGLTRGPRSL